MEIGKDLSISSYATKQRGPGRYCLYLSFYEVEGFYYMQDVYANLEEHFNITTESNLDFIKEYFNGDPVEIKIEE